MNKPFAVSCKFEIEKRGQCFLNDKRVALLKAIGQTGSTNAASKLLKMSYQQAWHFVKEMNELSPLPLVIKKRGGASGGGAELTKYGEKTIVEYEKIAARINSLGNELSDELWVCDFF